MPAYREERVSCRDVFDPAVLTCIFFPFDLGGNSESIQHHTCTRFRFLGHVNSGNVKLASVFKINFTSRGLNKEPKPTLLKLIFKCSTPPGFTSCEISASRNTMGTLAALYFIHTSFICPDLLIEPYQLFQVLAEVFPVLRLNGARVYA